MKTLFSEYHPVPSLVSGLFIFILCLLPGKSFPDVSWAAAVAPDKWVHFGLYAGWLWVYHYSGGKKILPVAAFMMLFGGGIEIIQDKFLTDRSGEWLDWAADGAGLALMSIIILIVTAEK